MTTIAWDGHSLAADQGTWTGGRIQQGSKLHVLEIEQDSLFGDAGDRLIVAHMGSCYANERVRKWVTATPGWDDELNLADTGHEGGDVVAVIVDKHKRVWDLSPYGHRYQSGCTRSHIIAYGRKFCEDLPDHHSTATPDYFAAWGAGGTFAFGALAAGRPAKEAVALAIEYTEFAAIGVDAINWDEVFDPARLAPLPVQFPPSA